MIPTENPNVLTLDKSLFQSVVRRISIFASKSTYQMKLKIAGASLELSAENVDYNNKAEEQLTCQYVGDDMSIGFNSKFLLEMLRIKSTEIKIEMSSSKSIWDFVTKRWLRRR